MCCFNRPRPMGMNQNCVMLVPAMPVNAQALSMPFMPEGIAAMPTPAFAQNAAAPMMPTNNVLQAATVPGNLSGFNCNANFETVERVMEQPLQCAPTVIHHHNRVQHMVPCIKTNIHHVHTHHEWLPFEQQEQNEVINHNHGVRPPDQALCNSV